VLINFAKVVFASGGILLLPTEQSAMCQEIEGPLHGIIFAHTFTDALFGPEVSSKFFNSRRPKINKHLFF
jgi:hypothetical protein